MAEQDRSKGWFDILGLYLDQCSVAEQELGGCPEITGWNSCTLPGIVCEIGVWCLDPGDYLASN